jgi:non-canonical purine NTP pyrophosphatase (RdgB/HAM1 family)
MGFCLERRSLDLPEPQALDPSEVVEAKARAAYAWLKRPVVVEDSGLAVHAWGGFPGALVKWLEKSAGVAAIGRMINAFPDRSATATCAIAYFDGKRLIRARGESRGTVAAVPRGRGGFGWDCVFVPEGSRRTFAEMRPEEKDRLSHRRRAWEALARRLARGPRSSRAQSPRPRLGDGPRRGFR